MTRSGLPRFTVMLARGLFKRCPRCGGRGLFAGYMTIRTACPGCRLPFVRTRGAMADSWFGAVMVNMAFTWVLIAITLTLGFLLTWPHPNALTLTLVMMAINGTFAFLFVPNSKTLWIALELWLRGLEPEDLADVDRTV